MLKAYKPAPLPVAFVAKQLHFNDDEEEDEEEDEEGGGGGEKATVAGTGAAKCADYLRAAGVVLVMPGAGKAGGGGETGGSCEADEAQFLDVDTKASSARPLELEALLAWEGMTGTLL